PMAGVSVKLYDVEHNLLDVVLSGSDGRFEFLDLPAATYSVDMHTPLGYVPITDAFSVPVAGGTHDLTLAIDRVESDEIRHIWWWKTYLADLRDDGPRQDPFTVQDINWWCYEIYNHFYRRIDEHRFRIEGVTHAANPDHAMVFEDVVFTMLDDDHSTYEAQVRYALLPNLLNIACGVQDQNAVATQDGATASQVINYCAHLYMDNAPWSTPEQRSALVTAFRALRDLSMGRTLPAGLVPADVPHVMYKNGNTGPTDLPPATAELRENYPNPFNPSTQISFALPVASRVRLTVYNVLGQVVTTLIDQDLPAGDYETTWHAERNASGVYFYRLTTDGTTLTRKMLLLK
ncbi:T9SS type A sorting domain-containing protein, partial [candidate division GN15 bacterium]|nr:T9SS type A sorting domain-containing protein [candidate division GN15 bacterium]